MRELHSDIFINHLPCPVVESTMAPSDENVCGTSPVGLLNYAISVDSLEILHDSSSVSNTAHSAGKTQISL